MAIPDLEPHCGSWMVTNKCSGIVIEFYDRSNVELFDTPDYRIETAAQYLARINKELKS